jgi:hypothetical protein
MKDGSQSKNLLNELGRDPQLLRAIAKAKHQVRGKGRAKVETATGVVLLLLAIAARFASKKKARAIDELRDVIYLLVQVSLLLKENIYDRPEVKEFFIQRSKQIYLLAQECVAMVLPKKKELRPKLRARSK